MSAKGKRFFGKTCVFCLRRPSTPAGEHIWSKWFLKDFSEEGPFTTFVNGKPDRKNDSRGSPIRSHESLLGAYVPCCARCNGILNRRFEVNAKQIVRALPREPADAWPVLSAVQSESLALWAIKIGLLLQHPETCHDDPAYGDRESHWDGVHHLVGWMVDGSPPPDGLSLYLLKTDFREDREPRYRSLIPSVTVGDQDLAFGSTNYGVYGNLTFHLVHHPNWPYRHRLVEESLAIELWPSSGSSIDLSQVRAVHPHRFSFIGGGRVGFDTGQFPRPDLPPLSDELDLSHLVSRGFARMVAG